MNGQHPVARAFRTGHPVLLPDIPDSLLEAISERPERLRIHRELGPRSTMVVPMTTHGRTLGVISFVSARSGRYGPADLLLGQEIARRAASAVDNARLYRELQEAVRARTEFFSSLSHDLKNPLATIKGVAQLLRRQVIKSDGPLDGRLESGLASIDATATKMAVLINELVDMAHLQVGDPLELDCQPVNLVTLVSQIVEEHRQSTDDHIIEFEALVPELTGLWDHGRLERVVANLMSNAIKYSPKGSVVTVKVSRETTEEGARAALVVHDQGIGIPENDLPHVFRGFHRAANVVGRVQGTGIGLASARRIVEQHGGRISVDSLEGRGSTFTVWLPLRGSGCGETY
jgi:signal transduction histidine kinase